MKAKKRYVVGLEKLAFAASQVSRRTLCFVFKVLKLNLLSYLVIILMHQQFPNHAITGNKIVFNMMADSKTNSIWIKDCEH